MGGGEATKHNKGMEGCITYKEYWASCLLHVGRILDDLSTV